MNIHIYEQDLTKYRSTFYKKLSEENDYSITIITDFGHSRGSFHDIDKKEYNYQIKEIKRHKLLKGIYLTSLKSIKKLPLPDIVILRGAVRDLNLHSIIRYYKKLNVPIIIRGQGFSRNRLFAPKKNFKDWYSFKIVEYADVYLSYTDDITNQLNANNPRSIIVTAPNTLNTDILDDHIKLLSKKTVLDHKHDLGLTKDKYLIYIGRIQKRKNVDTLISYYNELKANSDNDYGLIIIGEGELLDSIKEKALSLNLQDIVFTGFLEMDDILTSKYLYCSDIMFIPGWLGLAVNHGMYFGLPVIGVSVNGYIGHGPEIEYIKHYSNGYLMKDNSFDEFKIALDEVEINYKAYNKNALEYAKANLSINKMIKGYKHAIKLAKESVK